MPAKAARRPADTAPLPPGSWIGILGSGQLGRMLAMAAARFGFKCHIYADASGPAFDVAAAHTIASYDDAPALDRFAASVAVATYEFENIPVPTVEALARMIPVRPGAKALDTAQDRINEKRLARRLGASTADFAPVASTAALELFIDKGFTLPAILKTRRFGYDGKGQAKLSSRADAATAWAAMAGQPSILESFVDFDREVSIIAARGLDGSFAAYPLTENEHRNHILHRSLAPARTTATVEAEAEAVARRIADELDYVGVFAIELFLIDHDDGAPRLFFNEMAPRVHNSGHWTLDVAATSQFEQHIRAIAGWPLGSPALIAPGAEMVNLIGADIESWHDIAGRPGAVLHHYGKNEARPGRKMGHVNRRLDTAPA
ncbi:MAG: 5-(carboxyamino)imidazole ribonucleotide synthase [Hyphomicrobiaceae bacterium]